jgi:hypothetical protein
MRVKKDIKFSKATVHESCNTVVEKIVRISLLKNNLYIASLKTCSLIRHVSIFSIKFNIILFNLNLNFLENNSLIETFLNSITLLSLSFLQ